MPHIHVPEVLSFNGQEQTTREQEGGGGQNSRLFRHIHAMQADEKQRYTNMFMHVHVYHNGESMSRRKCASLQCEVRILTADAVWQDYAAYL